VVVDVEVLDPGRELDELHGAGAGIETGRKRQRDEETDDRADQRQHARIAGVTVAPGREHHEAGGDRQPDRQCEPGNLHLHLALPRRQHAE